MIHKHVGVNGITMLIKTGTTTKCDDSQDNANEMIIKVVKNNSDG